GLRSGAYCDVLFTIWLSFGRDTSLAGALAETRRILGIHGWIFWCSWVDDDGWTKTGSTQFGSTISQPVCNFTRSP
ncbi:hypothetical protein LINGRAHAP2_LOCUS9385, partial [Linum grandiflorum]